MNLPLLSFLIVAGTTELRYAQTQSPPPAPAPLASCVARVAERGLVRFELRRDDKARVPAYSAELVARPFDVNSPAPTAVLWRGSWSMPAATDPLVFASANGGRWALATSRDTGGGRAVVLWSGEAAALATQGLEPDRTVEQLVIFEVLIENESSELSRQNARMIDLASPQPFVWHDRIHLVASGMGNRRAPKDDRELVWITPLPDRGNITPEGLVRARAVGDGVDPRIALVYGQAILTMRAAFNPLDQRGESPVRIYRSTDLSNWSPDMELWQRVNARGNYDLAAAGGRLYLATTTGEDGTLLSTWSHDPMSRGKDWQRVASHHPGHDRVRSPTDRIWLIPLPSPDLRAPQLVFTGPDGALEQRRW